MLVLGANQLGVLASSGPTPASNRIAGAVLRVQLDPNERCMKRVIAMNRQFGDAVVAERLKRCTVRTEVVSRPSPSACLVTYPSVILYPLPLANGTPVPGCAAVSP